MKVLITLEQLNTSVVEKKNLNEQNFDSEPNCSGVVNFHCSPRMQMSLVMSVRFILGNDLNDVPCSSHSCSLAMM